MTDLHAAEGFYYSRDHLIERGCIENSDDENVFAYHSSDDWSAVSNHLKESWGHGQYWFGPSLIKETSMKNGLTNYIFRVSRTPAGSS